MHKDVGFVMLKKGQCVLLATDSTQMKIQFFAIKRDLEHMQPGTVNRPQQQLILKLSTFIRSVQL